MKKELLLKILTIACALLLIVTLILSICLIHSCSRSVECKHDDDDYLYIGDIGKNNNNNEDNDDTSVDLNDEWYDLDLPASQQSVTLSVSQISDKFEMRIANHSEYANSKATINGEIITYEGNEMDIRTSWYSETFNQYKCEYTIKGNNLYATPICISPSVQESAGFYSYNTDLVHLQTCLSSADEIRFDGNGITLLGVRGEFILTVTPVRGGPINFAYSKYLCMKGTVNEPADITLSWDDESLIVKSSADIQDFGADTSLLFSESSVAWADEIKKEYRITYIFDDFRYNAEIE